MDRWCGIHAHYAIHHIGSHWKTFEIRNTCLLHMVLWRGCSGMVHPSKIPRNFDFGSNFDDSDGQNDQEF